jgi:hypothetical protein
MHWFAMVGEDDDGAIDLLDLGRIPHILDLFFCVLNRYSNKTRSPLLANGFYRPLVTFTKPKQWWTMLCVRASDGWEEELTIALNPINMKPGARWAEFSSSVGKKLRWKT